MNDEIKIENLSKVKLDPGDILIYKISGPFSSTQIRTYSASLQKAFPDNRIICMPIDDALEVITPTESSPCLCVGVPSRYCPQHGDSRE